MITIHEYLKPTSLDKAYELLTSKRKATIIGGGAWLRLGSKKISTAIDLSALALNYIKETDEFIEIGAMTTFGELDRSNLIHSYFDGLIPHSFQNIVGVQLRNMVTVGGTVYSRFGFSDFITALAVLDCQVVFHHKGAIPLMDYLAHGLKEKDILEKIIIRKEPLRTSFQMLRNSKGDYAILNAAIAENNGQFRIAVGARPQRAALALEAMDYLYGKEITEQAATQAGELAASQLHLGTNHLASADYRKAICAVLVKRGIMEVIK